MVSAGAVVDFIRTTRKVGLSPHVGVAHPFQLAIEISDVPLGPVKRRAAQSTSDPKILPTARPASPFQIPLILVDPHESKISHSLQLRPVASPVCSSFPDLAVILG